VLICMILLVNNKKIMGIHVNKALPNIIAWVSIVILIALSSALLIIPFFNK